MAGICKSECGRNHFGALVAHAAAVVDDQADSGWAIFGLKYFYFLFSAVFIDVEIFRGQTGDRLAVVVQDSQVEKGNIDVNRDSELKDKQKKRSATLI